MTVLAVLKADSKKKFQAKFSKNEEEDEVDARPDRVLQTDLLVTLHVQGGLLLLPRLLAPDPDGRVQQDAGWQFSSHLFTFGHF